MSVIEVSAYMKVRDGKLDGFKRQAAECIRQTGEKDTKTLRYDWFISADGAQAEIREAYADSDGLLEHRAHIGEALDKLFSEFADDHTVRVYGSPSPELVERANAPQMVGKVSWYSFAEGLRSQGALLESIPA
jgi:quinol monooxygenase YgiN